MAFAETCSAHLLTIQVASLKQPHLDLVVGTFLLLVKCPSWESATRIMYAFIERRRMFLWLSFCLDHSMHLQSNHLNQDIRDRRCGYWPKWLGLMIRERMQIQDLKRSVACAILCREHCCSLLRRSIREVLTIVIKNHEHRSRIPASRALRLNVSQLVHCSIALLQCC